jgi:hypothetical protein
MDPPLPAWETFEGLAWEENQILRRNTLSGPIRDVKPLGPARCQPLKRIRDLAGHVIRVRFATSESIWRVKRREES